MLLSILIPAYEYPHGIERILSRVLNCPSHDIEVIVSDDSSSGEVHEIVARFKERFPRTLQYKRNAPSLGAVANWNSLLTSATGEYALLLHHDEYPLDESFIDVALASLRESPDVDVVVMECLVSSCLGRITRPHLPRVIRESVVMRWPDYLFRRNVIGPTSCLIVRTSLYPKFDLGLKWLVDVDAYVRLRRASRRWALSDRLTMVSDTNRAESITSSLRGGLRGLALQERKLLEAKHPKSLLLSDSKWIRPLWLVESLLWRTMRVITRAWYCVGYARRPTASQ